MTSAYCCRGSSPILPSDSTRTRYPRMPEMLSIAAPAVRGPEPQKLCPRWWDLSAAAALGQPPLVAPGFPPECLIGGAPPVAAVHPARLCGRPTPARAKPSTPGRTPRRRLRNAGSRPQGRRRGPRHRACDRFRVQLRRVFLFDVDVHVRHGRRSSSTASGNQRYSCSSLAPFRISTMASHSGNGTRLPADQGCPLASVSTRPSMSSSRMGADWLVLVAGPAVSRWVPRQQRGPPLQQPWWPGMQVDNQRRAVRCQPAVAVQTAVAVVRSIGPYVVSSVLISTALPNQRYYSSVIPAAAAHRPRPPEAEARVHGQRLPLPDGVQCCGYLVLSHRCRPLRRAARRARANSPAR